MGVIITYGFSLLALLILAPWPDQIYPDLVTEQAYVEGQGVHMSVGNNHISRLASAQGLSVSDERLGAGEEAAFEIFSQFESVLELSDDFTGGRGARNRRTSRRAVFDDAQSFRRQQLELYHVAGSPLVYHSFNTSQTVEGKNYLPKFGDQGDCSTCVAYAVTAAATASVASALRVDATEWDISPQSLYYCSTGGKTCASGWQIEAALFELEDNPGVVRPSNCFSEYFVEPEIGSWTGVCTAAATKCSLDDMSKPWLSCSYRTMSTFWQIQQSVMQYGGVVTRITIYDDFRPFFNPRKTGLENGIYTPGPGAKKLYGHAAVIVGYDNINKACNKQAYQASGIHVAEELGSVTQCDFLRNAPWSTVSFRTLLNSWGNSSTSDGLFRIAMGQAGVGVPDETFAVICEPRTGTDLDLHDIKPWRRKHRKPVRLVDRKDRDNLSAQCYLYDAVRGDTAASIADVFLLDIRKFVQDNTKVFAPVAVTSNFNESLTSEQVAAVLNNVKSQQQFPAAAEPYFRCTSASGAVNECRIGGTAQPCTGVTNCTLLYQEPDVTIDPAGQTLLICNISLATGQFDAIAQFKDPAVSQPRALRRWLDAYKRTDVQVPNNYCSLWLVRCVDGWVTQLEHASGYEPVLNRELAEVLLTFERLEGMGIYVAIGSILPPQLGGLSRLRSIWARSVCWDGELPPNLGRGWSNIQYVSIGSWQKVANCGIRGTLPVLWGSTMPNLFSLELPFNRLSGPLPAEYSGMVRMERLILSGNQLTGLLPGSYSQWGSARDINLHDNNLQGEVPPSWSQFKGRLQYLTLSSNPRLRGCIPLTGLTIVRYADSRLTGLCTTNKEELEEQQAAAFSSLLQPLFNADGEDWSAIRDLRNVFSRPLGQIFRSGGGLEEDGGGFQTSRGYVGQAMRLIDGIVYLIAIDVTGGGLDLTLLTDLVTQLPYLIRFNCEGCNYNNQNASAMQLPASLIALAPKTLERLNLQGSDVQGVLPEEWGQWSTLKEIVLPRNKISGTLPASWKGMSSMQYFDISRNLLTGTLPPDWGSGGITNVTVMYLNDNPGLTGTIPAAWSTFMGGIYLERTNVTGCIPDQLMTNVFWDQPYIPCSQVSPEVKALLDIRTLLDPSGEVLASWTQQNSGAPQLPSAPPGYCRRFLGVRCNRSNQVESLDLSQLSRKGLKSLRKVTVTDLLKITSRLPHLQVLNLSGNSALFRGSRLQSQSMMLPKGLRHLDLSGCDLSGPLPASLATAFSLQHLNLSSNPRLSGNLPQMWTGLTSLQVLDVSSCGVKGSLPAAWATMQQLRIFKASSNKPGVSGKLPESWGILRNLEVLDVRWGRLTGSLPQIWADPAALAARSSDDVAATSQLLADTAQEAAELGDEPQMPRLSRAASGVAATPFQRSLDPRSTGRLGMLKLRELNLSGNRLTGQLPNKFAALKDLRIISLRGNKLNGPLPVQWAALENLEVLDLSDNNLSGPLPEIWGAMLGLQVLSLSKNSFSGSLPGLWGGLRSLRMLDLRSCGLQGEIPKEWFALREVESINLSGNLLIGGFPQEWGVMRDSQSHKLRLIDLSNNPCMNKAVLQQGIQRSKITAGQKVAVIAENVGNGGRGCA